MPRVSPFIFLKMAFLSLRRHPIRSGLALLGIIIGIASMIVTMALGEGANERLKKDILAMGENWIYVLPGNFINKGEVRRTKKQEKDLSYEDYLAIRQLSSSIQACTPCLESKEIVKYQGNQVVAEIKGFNAEFFRIESRGIKRGSSFSSYHDHHASPVAVLGSETAKELFKQENPIGKIILIDQAPFKVIGVFNEAAKRVNQMNNPNLNLVVPFSSIRRKMMSANESSSLHHIILRPKEDKNSAQLVTSLRRLLRFRHQIVEGESDDFTIWDLQAMMQVAHKSSQVFNQFLLIAASISLIVGGIGIMNIMLVAMTERRQEIGIKMALGATSTHILTQFLIESILLCLTGGIIGVLCGIGGAGLLGYFTDFEWALGQTSMVIAFMTTLMIGIFFGFYPAYKASQLHPIEALQ